MVVAVALILAACAEPPPVEEVPPSPPPSRPIEPLLVVDEPAIPAEEAYEFAAIAPDADELMRQWSRFRLRREAPEVDFDTHVVLLVGFGESGSCPYEYDELDIDRERGRVTILANLTFAEGAGFVGACTSDYNPRTFGFTIGRRLLPEGIFQVNPPNGGLVSVAAEAVETPPFEPPDIISTGISEVEVVLDPEPVAADGHLHVGIRNDSHAQVVSSRMVVVDRWTGLGFEPFEPYRIRGKRARIFVEPASEEPLMSIDVAHRGLVPAWYRITVDLGVTRGDFGRLLIRRPIQVVESTTA